MPRPRQAPPVVSDQSNYMSLKLECWPDELSPAQLAAYETAESEHFSIRSKLNEIVSAGGGENVFLGEIFSAYQVPGPAIGLEEIAKPLTAVRKETRLGRPPKLDETRVRVERELPPRRRGGGVVEVPVEEPVEDKDDDEYVPMSKRAAVNKVARLAAERKREAEREAAAAAKAAAAAVAAAARKPAVGASPPNFRPSENSSIGGLSVGDASRNKKDVVDLTKDDPPAKGGPDSKEVTFNKLQGKTFPSLVVMARPSLRIKDAPNDRPVLDAKVKSVLMHTATKFTEWLIQQGLVRSEQACQIHPGKSLKLGKY